LGPSAHSYNGISRRWNASNIETYRKGIEKGTVYYEEETLSEIEKYNEYLITRLRTKWGVSLEEIEAQFGETIKQAFQKNIRQYVDSGKIIRENDVFKFSHEGLFVSDNVLANLIII
ncbi:MAG TPA: hypothetical protein VKA10_05730, partial [Prolixibacteraceae bacterium]|nr:hypothetical protein [Prolixibacteraceae bacterium]